MGDERIMPSANGVVDFERKRGLNTTTIAIHVPYFFCGEGAQATILLPGHCCVHPWAKVSLFMVPVFW